MRTRWLAAGATAVLVLAACNNAEPTPNPELAFCDSLETLAGAVATVDELNAQSTVDDVQTAIEGVTTAAAGVRESANDLAESQVDAIESAADELKSYGESIEGSETVEQAIAGLGEQIAAVKAARQEAGQAHCGLVEAQAAASSAAEQIDAAQSAAAEQIGSAASAVAGAIASLVPDALASPG